MSPRGVAIPDVRERLFSAAERVLDRADPVALTSRAVTDEADCAKGLLHAHFSGGLDEFVAELVLDRFARTARLAGELSARAGRATVADNLTGVALALLTSTSPKVAGLALARPGAADLVRRALESGAPGFAAVQDSVTGYLDAERQLGRLTEGADTASLALALVGTVHHLLMTSWAGSPDPRDQVERLIVLLCGAVTPP
ncbi:TetR/AcrR family transcriptional regulator [Streptomyces sp. NBC_01465]|uniref:TetR/AcrR family transcriptional regulator n=1 Tax=Streptomyces sp. NBC_01465 TaxID=2903878 RepID=UPI002E321203|nr:TetR/AcrR family transcriptional regulator [Streptomyces sp. NBC_01465]